MQNKQIHIFVKSQNGGDALLCARPLKIKRFQITKKNSDGSCSTQNRNLKNGV